VNWQQHTHLFCSLSLSGASIAFDKPGLERVKG
jgi:hypothetical protein